MFGFIRDLAKTTVNVVKLPVSITLDTLTCGGMAIDREENFTEVC